MLDSVGEGNKRDMKCGKNFTLKGLLELFYDKILKIDSILGTSESL